MRAIGEQSFRVRGNEETHSCSKHESEDPFWLDLWGVVEIDEVDF